MDLNDTPEQAQYRAKVRAWLEEHAGEAPAEQDSDDPAHIDARRAWQGKLAGAGLAGVTWPAELGGQGLGAVEHVIVGQEIARAGVPGILDVIGVGMLGPDDHRPRQRRAEGPLPRADAARRRGLVPAVLRARRGLGPRRGAGSRGAAGRRRLAPVGPEGVDDERALRRLRAAAGAHRRRRPQAQGADDVHRPDGRRRRDDPRAAPDLRRGGVQRGLLRRRAPGGRRRRRRGRQRLGHGADDAHVRAADDRPGLRGPRLQARALRRGDRRPTSTRGATPRCAAGSASCAPSCSP